MNEKLNNAEWSFVQETGCLTITGTGKMQNWTEHQERPWEEIRDEIRRVRICTGLESVGDCAFQNCTSLEEVELPETLVYLGVYSFRGCTALKDVKLPEGIRIICAKAFHNCTALEKVELPVSLKNIDMRAFAKDEALHTVIYHGTAAQWEKILISGTASDNQYLLAAERKCLKEEPAGYRETHDNPVADRYEEMVDCVKKALSYGGDGNLYFLTPDLTEPGIRAKCGDCTLVVFPNGKTMMIDAGYIACSAHIISLLEDLGLHHLDYFVLSHAHDDHAGGALAVAQYLYEHGEGIDACYRSSYIASSKQAPLFEEYLKQKGTHIYENVLAGYQWTIGDVRITAYHPTTEDLEKCVGNDESVNNVSILMKFVYGRSKYLTGGDLYLGMEEKLAQQYGELLKADVMKSNHHGTYTSNGQKWLQTVQPNAIITDAEDIGNALLAEYAAEHGINYYSAGVQGLILLRMSRIEYEIQCQTGDCL
ncbi:MAG TPA: hypothetical protein DCG10_11425 [Lachnospiraceae bacterium]|nr:hypothetical protein [Lachnospiraceae bacterium]